jgi:translocator protein
LAQLARLAACIVICFLPALVGGLFPPGEWYAGLTKPALTPPGWVFGPVWTLLYLMMGVSSYLVLGRTSVPGSRAALAIFGLQLLLNGLWSYLFFGLERPGLALVEILLLWLSILASTLLFWRLRPAAGALLVPYLAWVSFASWLNFGLWRLNS